MQDIWSSRKVIDRLYFRSLVLCPILAILGWIFFSLSFALSILVGGIISVFNFYWFEKGLQKLFDPNVVVRIKMFYYLKYYGRLFLLGLVLYVLIRRHMIHPIGFIIGLSVILINIMILAFSELWKIIAKKEAH